MKVVLLQDVKKMGKKGDVIEVADAYGRNVLIRKGLGVEGTKANLNTASQRFHFRSHVRDRHGGFRGNAGHFAVVVFIEHHVTCDKDPALGCARGDKAIKFLLIHKFLKFHHITELPLE